jgi:hypothetical protein
MAREPIDGMSMRPPLVRRALRKALVALVLSLAACRGGDATRPSSDVSGQWAGADELYDSLHLDLSQSVDGTVTGTGIWWLLSLPISRQATVTGTNRESALSLTLTKVNPRPTDFYLSLTLTGHASGNEIVGDLAEGPFRHPMRFTRR